MLPQTARSVPAKERPLTPKQALFVAEYLVSLNASLAYKTAYKCSERVANINGAKLLVNASIQSAIAAAMAKRSARTEITQDMVLQELWDTATADPRELVEYRRTCCRYCWGVDNEYHLAQWEIDDRNADAESSFERRKNKKPTDKIEYPSELGGPGYDPRKDANANCPRCYGEGVERFFLNDTRALSRKARLLYAGVKQTKEGLEVKMRDQHAALVKVGEHIGMFKGLNVNLNLNLDDLNEAQLEHIAKGGSVATIPR